MATEIISTNEFGNIIFKTIKNHYWRICPEEISCVKIAKNESDLNIILSDADFIDDWKMTNLVELAKSEIGESGKNEKYCLKMAAVIGGPYEKDNLDKIKFSRLIAFSGDLGYQIKEIKDGQKIELNDR